MSFPDSTIWANDDNGKGYDIVMLGQAGPTKINVEDLHSNRSIARTTRSSALSLRDVGFKSVIELLGTYGGQAAPISGTWLKNAEINHDRDLRLQYLAGMDAEPLSGSQQSSTTWRSTAAIQGDLFIASGGTEKGCRWQLSGASRCP